MEIALYCSPDSIEVLTGIIENRGFTLNNNASIAVVEKGIDLPANVIAIVFELKNLDLLVNLLEMLPVKKEGLRNAIVGKKGDSYEIVSFEKILYFDAEGNDVYCCTLNERLLVKNKLYELEDNLFDRGFIRVNKSVIVNIIALKEVIPWFDSRFILKLQNNTQLEVSKKYSKNFKDFICL